LKRIKQQQGKKIYFASDFHMGAPSLEASREREQQIVDWLDHISKDAQCIFLVGDIFDFWFEYKQVVPKGFIRLQGKIATLSDSGIDIYFFLGNHDMWMKNYFAEELGVTMIPNELELDIDGKILFVAHGDGLGPGDRGYKFVKKVFRNKFCQFLFSCLHPRIGLSLAQYFSNKSRIHTGTKDDNYDGKESEWLYQFSKERLKASPVDYFIFGHRHLPMVIQVSTARYINLGEWMNYATFATYNEGELDLKVWSGGSIEEFKGIQES
jgi:UDP-2,3-diacylglucosamine hydrolase